MKKKIIIKDNISNKIIEEEFSIADKEYLTAVMKNKVHVFEDKRKKKPKHKKNYLREED